MSSDGPIVDEVRQRRGQISTRFDDDLDRYGKHLLELQKKYLDRLVNQITVVQGTMQAAGRANVK